MADQRPRGKRSAAFRAAEVIAREEWARFQRGSVMHSLIPAWREIAPLARERMVRRVVERGSLPGKGDAA